MAEARLTIYRFDPHRDQVPYFQYNKVEAEENSSVLDILIHIQQKIEPGLAFRSICGKMKCGECAITVNQSPCLACEKMVEPDMIIEPLPNLPIIRDLTIDRHRVIGDILRLAPSLLEPKGSPDFGYIETYLKLTTCMECLICQSVCPVTKKKQEEFIGPLGLLWLAQRSIDLKDHPKWQEDVRKGLETCLDCERCWKACVLETDILELAIGDLRNLSNVSPETRSVARKVTNNNSG
jgi:succinate dehydrogenase/fumarate reductase iron-sulfur protein